MKMMSEYEEVNAVSNASNCVTMITVMPGTTRSTLTSSGSEAVLEMAPSSARESETSSSEGGSFIIDSTAFYENLSFHRMRCSNLMASRTSAASTDEDFSLGGKDSFKVTLFS